MQINLWIFKFMTDFNCWKKDIEEKELCQYVKSTSSKTNEDKKYIYYYCHRSFSPRIMNKVNLIFFNNKIKIIDNNNKTGV